MLLLGCIPPCLNIPYEVCKHSSLMKTNISMTDYRFSFVEKFSLSNLPVTTEVFYIFEKLFTFKVSGFCLCCHCSKNERKRLFCLQVAAINPSHPLAQMPLPPSMKNCIQLAACEASELLPMNPDLPADLFTSCLTTPIKIALRW